MAFLNPKTVVDGQSMSVLQLLPNQYIIPTYQRDFAWGSKQIIQLWDDLIEHYRRTAPDDNLTNASGYFLGAMVTIEEVGQLQLQVVDGQQRLTTLSILIIVLHEAIERYAKNEPQSTAILHALMGCWLRVEGGQFLPFLTYSDPDTNQAFVDFCVKNTTRKQRRKFWNNLPRKKQKNSAPHATVHAAFVVTYQKLFSFMRDGGAEARSKRLISFAQLILDCIVLLRIKAASYESAYAIFESLNDRGLRLSQADLIKNELLKVAAPSDRDDIVEAWTNAKQILADTPITLAELLHYTCLHRYGDPKAQALFSFVKSHLAGGASAKEFSSKLQEDAKAIEQLLVQRPTTWTTDTYTMLDDISKVLAVKFSYPMLLAAYRKLKNVPTDLQCGVRLIMNFVFRFMKVGNGSPERLAVISGRVGQASRDSSLTNDEFLAKIGEEFRNESSDKLFIQEFKEYSEANTKQAYFTVYYLERHLLNGTIPLDHGVESNLEHIMPKVPTSTQWPGAYALKASDPALYASLVWRIGNLLPLPEAINKSIKNKNIHHKMSGGTQNYSTCSLESPQSIGEYLGLDAVWDENSIELRQKDLADLAPNVWSLTP